MKPVSIARLVAAVLILLGLGLFEYGRSRHRAALQELTALQSQRALRNSRLRPAPAKIESSRPAPAIGQAPPAATSGKRGVARPVPHVSPASGLLVTLVGDLALVSSQPELRDLFLRNFRANLGQRFGEFYWLAGLSPPQIAQFEELAVRRQEAAVDLATVASARGLNDADPAIASTRAQQDEQYEADQIALLGDTGYRQLQQFKRQEPAVGLLNNLAYFTQAAGDGSPTRAQTGQLLQIIANASQSFQQGRSLDLASVDWDQVVAQAADILSPAQLNALKVDAQNRKLASQLLPAYLAQQSAK